MSNDTLGNDMTATTQPSGLRDGALSFEAMTRRAAEAARLLKALSHETRLLLLCHLVEGEFSVGELNERVPVSQSVLSQHLRVLRQDNLVQTRRESQTIYYRLADDRAERVLAVLYDMFCRNDMDEA